MKKSIQNFLIIICVIIFTISCSTENELITTDQEAITIEIEENKTIKNDGRRSRPLIIKPVVTPIRITYDPGLSQARIDIIRALFTNDRYINIQTIEVCPKNNEEEGQTEIWWSRLSECTTSCRPLPDPQGDLEGTGGVSRAALNESECL